VTLRTHNLRSELLKCDFGDVDEAKIHYVERPFERFFYILGIQRSNFDKVAEVMFYVSEWP
jgi:hypothetical protein